MDFNSTTVRLGVNKEGHDGGGEVISIPPRYDWERTARLIRLPTYLISIPPRYDWELLGYWPRSLLELFQFHHGTIGSQLPGHELKDWCFISIPPRYDWERLSPLTGELHHIFQFHHGTIGRLINSHTPSSAVISIPPRYDWEFQIVHYLQAVLLNFNSTTVRLGVVDVSILLPSC